ncbi:MAG: GNAT family N-acetyltransferase [Bacteroidota bacterium]
MSVRIVQVGFEALPIIRELNRTIFDEERVINRFDRPDLTMFIAYLDQQPVGFKVGYALDAKHYYSAKGGVLSGYRRHGIATTLLDEMMAHVRTRGFTQFLYDTFPNRHAGMAILGFQAGFKIVEAEFSEIYKDYRLRLSIEL